MNTSDYSTLLNDGYHECTIGLNLVGVSVSLVLTNEGLLTRTHANMRKLAHILKRHSDELLLVSLTAS